MANINIKHEHLNDIMHNIFIRLMDNVHPIRKNFFQIKGFSHNKTNKINMNAVIMYCTQLLSMYNITNVDISKWHIEFQQYNCFGTDKGGAQFSWHKDDHGAVSYDTWSIILYLRKDITIKEGNFDYADMSNNRRTLNINERDVLLFPGNIYHAPTPVYGTGCRDLIVVFFKRT